MCYLPSRFVGVFIATSAFGFPLEGGFLSLGIAQEVQQGLRASWGSQEGRLAIIRQVKFQGFRLTTYESAGGRAKEERKTKVTADWRSIEIWGGKSSVEEIFSD